MQEQTKEYLSLENTIIGLVEDLWTATYLDMSWVQIQEI